LGHALSPSTVQCVLPLSQGDRVLSALHQFVLVKVCGLADDDGAVVNLRTAGVLGATYQRGDHLADRKAADGEAAALVDVVQRRRLGHGARRPRRPTLHQQRLEHADHLVAVLGHGQLREVAAVLQGGFATLARLHLGTSRGQRSNLWLVKITDEELFKIRGYAFI